jgi:hypothetical protein
VEWHAAFLGEKTFEKGRIDWLNRLRREPTVPSDKRRSVIGERSEFVGPYFA